MQSPWMTKGLIVSQKRKEKIFSKKKEILQIQISKNLMFIITSIINLDEQPK